MERGCSVAVTGLIRNIGELPLVVYDTRTSCGCTDVSYTKEPVPPGSSMEIKINYNAEDEGYFNKIVSVYGNFNDSPLVIRIKGNIKKISEKRGVQLFIN